MTSANTLKMRRWRQTDKGRLAVRRCNNGPGAAIRRQRHQLNNPRFRAVQAEARYRNKYGIDFEDWARLYEAQNGHCPGCHLPLKFDRTTHVDHCHKTGKVRGLLCNDCNLAVGFLHNSTNIAQSLARYLQTNGLHAVGVYP